MHDKTDTLTLRLKRHPTAESLPFVDDLHNGVQIPIQNDTPSFELTTLASKQGQVMASIWWNAEIKGIAITLLGQSGYIFQGSANGYLTTGSQTDLKGGPTLYPIVNQDYSNQPTIASGTGISWVPGNSEVLTNCTLVAYNNGELVNIMTFNANTVRVSDDYYQVMLTADDITP